MSEPVTTLVPRVPGVAKEALKNARATDIRAPAGVPRRTQGECSSRSVCRSALPAGSSTNSVACPMSVGLRRPVPARRVDVDHALASVRPAMARPSVLRGSGARIAVHVEVPVPAFQHVFDASGGVPEAFDRLGLEHLHERAERTPIGLLQCIEVPGLLQCRDHRCRLRSPGEDVAHQRPCRASVPVFERVDLHETVVQSAGRSSIGLQFIGSSAERWQSSFAARRPRSGDRRRIQSLAPFLLLRRPRVISRRLGLPGALLLADHALRRSESPDNGVPARVRSRRFAHPAAGASRTAHRRARPDPGMSPL